MRDSSCQTLTQLQPHQLYILGKYNQRRLCWLRKFMEAIDHKLMQPPIHGSKNNLIHKELIHMASMDKMTAIVYNYNHKTSCLVTKCNKTQIWFMEWVSGKLKCPSFRNLTPLIWIITCSWVFFNQEITTRDLWLMGWDMVLEAAHGQMDQSMKEIGLTV